MPALRGLYRSNEKKSNSKRPAWSKRLSDIKNADPKPTFKTSLNAKYDRHRLYTPDYSKVRQNQRTSASDAHGYRQDSLRDVLSDAKERWIDDLVAGRLPPKHGQAAREWQERHQVEDRPQEYWKDDPSIQRNNQPQDWQDRYRPYSPSLPATTGQWMDQSQLQVLPYDPSQSQRYGLAGEEAYLQTPPPAYQDTRQMSPPSISIPPFGFHRRLNQDRSPSIDFDPQDSSTPQPRETVYFSPDFTAASSPLYPPLRSPGPALPRASALRPAPSRGILKRSHLQPSQVSDLHSIRHPSHQAQVTGNERYHPYRPQSRLVRFGTDDSFRRYQSPFQMDPLSMIRSGETPAHVPRRHLESLNHDTTPVFNQNNHNDVSSPQDIVGTRNSPKGAAQYDTVPTRPLGNRALSFLDRMDGRDADLSRSLAGNLNEEEADFPMIHPTDKLDVPWGERNLQDVRMETLERPLRSDTDDGQYGDAESDEMNLRELDESIDNDVIDTYQPRSFGTTLEEGPIVPSSSSYTSPSSNPFFASEDDGGSDYVPSDEDDMSEEEGKRKLNVRKVTADAWSFYFPSEVINKAKLNSENLKPVPRPMSKREETQSSGLHDVNVENTACEGSDEPIETIDQFSDVDPASQKSLEQSVEQIESSPPDLIGEEDVIDNHRVLTPIQEEGEEMEVELGSNFFAEGGQLGFRIWRDEY